MYKILSSLVLAGVLLGGCAESTEDQNAVGATEEVPEVAEEEAEESEESRYFIEDLQTTFPVESTKTPTISEEEKAIGFELSQYVSEASTILPGEEEPEYLSDWEHIENASHNFPNYTTEELYDIYSRYYEDIFFGDRGEYYLEGFEVLELEKEVIASNLRSNDVVSTEGTFGFNETYDVVKITGDYTIDGKRSKITMYLELNDDYTEATLLRLKVDNEEAMAFKYEDINGTFN